VRAFIDHNDAYSYEDWMNVHINSPIATERALRRTHCPTCDRRRWFAAWFYEWYGWNMTCLRCGDQWSDGAMCPRPFERGWRKKSVAAVIKRWRQETKRAAASSGTPTT